MGLLRMAARTAVVAGTAPPCPGAWRVVRTPSLRSRTHSSTRSRRRRRLHQRRRGRRRRKTRESGAAHAQGVLTDEEFAAAKAKILGI